MNENISNWIFTENFFDFFLKSINDDWKDFFKREDIYKLLKDIVIKLCEEQELFEGHLNIFPTPDLVFNSIKDLSPKDIKVIILGQDPYHQPNQAMGLSFSVPESIKIPPSLINIYKELSNDIDNFIIPKNGDLTKWKNEKILMLNSSLTVLESKPMKHMKYWKPITDKMIEYISEMNQVKIFMLWGNSSKAKKNYIKESNKNYILEANHPSPLSANRGGWFGCKHFSKINKLLKDSNRNEIKW